MADIKTLVEEAKIALGIALDSAEYCGHSLAGTMTLRRATEDREDVIKALDAIAEAHQAEVARLTRENEALAKALKPFVGATLTENGHIVGLMREDFDRARAALAGASGAQEGERT